MCMLAVFAFSAVCFAAYHHEGEKDADKFLQVYPDKAGTKLDHCALCHSSGKYEKSEGSFVSLGSCQWCHYSYGYDGSGNILDTMNAYGKAYHDNGRNAAAISAIETADSDGDGFANKAEIDANTFPGNSEDDPSKKTAPFRVYTKAQLEAMPQHTQFLLMNTSKSGDFYAEYSGVAVEDLLLDAGISDSATGITVYAPDGWAQYHPLKYDAAPEMYHVFGAYPEASYQYDPEAESWCDYSAASCKGRKHNDIIAVSGGLKMLLAYKRDGAYLDAGVLSASNKLDGEGPYRVVRLRKRRDRRIRQAMRQIRMSNGPTIMNGIIMPAPVPVLRPLSRLSRCRKVPPILILWRRHGTMWIREKSLFTGLSRTAKAAAVIWQQTVFGLKR